MKAGFSVLLLLLILTQPLFRLGIFYSFKINQKSIALNLCEKRMVNFNTCQGRCFLKKQLKKADESARKVGIELGSEFEKQILLAGFLLPKPAICSAIPLDFWSELKTEINSVCFGPEAPPPRFV